MIERPGICAAPNLASRCAANTPSTKLLVMSSSAIVTQDSVLIVLGIINHEISDRSFSAVFSLSACRKDILDESLDHGRRRAYDFASGIPWIRSNCQENLQVKRLHKSSNFHAQALYGSANAAVHAINAIYGPSIRRGHDMTRFWPRHVRVNGDDGLST